MFEKLIEVLNHRAKAVKTADTQELAQHKKTIEPDKQRLLKASESLKAATDTANDCLSSLGRIQWPGGNMPQTISQRASELNEQVFSAHESIGKALAELNGLTLEDFTQRLPYANGTKAFGLRDLIPGLCALPGEIIRLVKAIEGDIKAYMQTGGIPASTMAPRLKSEPPKPEPKLWDVRQPDGPRTT